MNGEIKVVKKSGHGTLMQLYLLLNAPPESTTKKNYQLNFDDHNLTVLLALNGRKTKSILNQWLRKNGVHTHEASEWNELTLNLHEFFKEYSETRKSNIEIISKSIFVIIIDIGMLDLTTELWKQQLNFLDEYCKGRANFAWILNHDTSNSIKAELRKRGHLLMVNRPLYKAKMIQIFESVIKEKNNLSHLGNNVLLGEDAQFHELVEIDDNLHSDDSDKSENDCCNTTSVIREFNGSNKNIGINYEEKSLEGLRVLLAEDTPVLQRVAKIMLEKLGAKVVVVGDGIQAVEALDRDGKYDLILMDCQMPKMDGYEATKAIRRSELGSGMHVPIVALTAHAMSCDEAKCLQVGMDAYLTKPIDCKRMISTILSLTKQNE